MRTPIKEIVTMMVILLNLSCSDEASPIGSDFFDGGSLNLVTIDTLTIRTSTVRFDSLVTSDATRLLVGLHEDEDLGKISSTAFMEIGIPKALSLEKESTIFSRAELRLVHDGYSYYDTTTEISFDVHRLAQRMEIEDSYLYNTSSFRYNVLSMGSVTYKPRPHNTSDTIAVPLSTAFGTEIIRLAQAASTDVGSTAAFLNIFYGLALVPKSLNGPVIGYSTTAQIRVYYMDRSETPQVEKYLTLETGDLYRFNHITSDRSATNLVELDDQRENLSSDKTGEKSYIQSGSGLALRIDLPYVRNILIDNEGLNIVTAVLEISPSKENDDDNTSLFSTLVMSGVNYKNEIIASYESTGILYEDVYLGRDTHYAVDITRFVKEQLATEEFNENGLVLTPEDELFRSSVSRLYAGDQFNDRQMKLKISCVTYSK